MRFTEAIVSGYTWVSASELASIGWRKGLTARSRFNRDLQISMFAEENGWVGLPRYALSIEADRLLDNTYLGFPIKFDVTSDFRPGQQDFVNEFNECIQKLKTGFLVEAPTASGKTFLAIHMIRSIGRTALVVVPKSDLVDQWVVELLKHTTMPRSEIGIGIGGSIEWEGKAIVIALVHTLALDRGGPLFKGYFGTVLFDEADRSVPPTTFAPVVPMFPAKYRIAMSATLKRRDGLHVIIEKHIGEERLTAGPGKKLPSTVIMHFQEWKIKSPPDHLDLMVRRSIYLKQIGRHYERNRRIAKYAKMFLNGGRRVIIFSDYTNQLYLIKKILEGELGVLPDEIGYYTRSVRIDGKSQAVPEKERIRAAKSCKVLLATYKMLQAGTDMPEVSGIVFASPQVDATQATGRIERFKEKKKQPIVVDLVDVDSDLALRWAISREEEYMRRRLTVKKIGVEKWTKQPIRKSITWKKGGSYR